jgi:uncharacterized protein YifN (PemK superfamily)
MEFLHNENKGKNYQFLGDQNFVKTDFCEIISSLRLNADTDHRGLDKCFNFMDLQAMLDSSNTVQEKSGLA